MKDDISHVLTLEFRVLRSLKKFFLMEDSVKVLEIAAWEEGLLAMLS